MLATTEDAIPIDAPVRPPMEYPREAPAANRLAAATNFKVLFRCRKSVSCACELFNCFNSVKDFLIAPISVFALDSSCEVCFKSSNALLQCLLFEASSRCSSPPSLDSRSTISALRPSRCNLRLAMVASRARMVLTATESPHTSRRLRTPIITTVVFAWFIPLSFFGAPNPGQGIS